MISFFSIYDYRQTSQIMQLCITVVHFAPPIKPRSFPSSVPRPKGLGVGIETVTLRGGHCGVWTK